MYAQSTKGGGVPTMCQKQIPEYVKRNLEWYLDHEQEHPEEYGKVILDMSIRWGF